MQRRHASALLPFALLLCATASTAQAQINALCNTDGLTFTPGGGTIAFEDTVRALVVLVRFQDDYGNTPSWPGTREELPPFADWLVESDPARVRTSVLTPDDSSLSAYFLWQSHTGPAGPHVLVGDVWPRNPVTQEPEVYVTRHPESWYYNDPSDPPAERRGYGYLTREVLDHLDSLRVQTGFDIGRFDTNRDGTLDHMLTLIRWDRVSSGGQAALTGTNAVITMGRPPVTLRYWSPSRQTNIRVDWDFSGSMSVTGGPGQALLAHEYGHRLFSMGHTSMITSNTVPLALLYHGLPDTPENFPDRTDRVKGCIYNRMCGRGSGGSDPAARTLAASEMRRMRWVAPVTLDPAAGDQLGLPLRSLYRHGDVYLAQLRTGSSPLWLSLENRQRDNFFDREFVVADGGPGSQFGRELGGLGTTGLLATLSRVNPANPTASTGYDVLFPDNEFDAVGRCDGWNPVCGGLDAFRGDMYSPQTRRQLTPWTRPNVNGCNGYGTEDPFCSESGFTMQWFAVDNIRYVAGPDSTILFDFWADFRTAPTVALRADSWMGAETSNTTFPTLVRVTNEATLTIEAGTALTFDSGLTVDAGSRLVVEAGATLRFGPGTKLTGNGRVEIRGTAVAPVLLARQNTPGSAWGGVLLLANSSLIEYARVEGATVGVEVRAQNVALTSATLTANQTGLATDQVPCQGDVCIEARSSLAIETSCLVENTGVGLLARNADLTYLYGLRVAGNGSSGVVAQNATLSPLLQSIVNGNGGSFLPAPAGVSLLNGGALALFAQFHPHNGYNRVSGHAGDEIAAAAGALLYVGLAGGLGTNRLSDAGGGVLVRNTTGATVQARNTWWGQAGGPPAGAVVGPVNTQNALSSDPSGPFPTACIGYGGGAGLRAGGPGSEAASFTASALATPPGASAADTRVAFDPDAPTPEAAADSLRQAITEARAALAAADASGDGAAPEAVRELYGLQRLDPDDALGEHAQTMALIATIRQALDAPDVPEAERPGAEAALVCELDEALRLSDYPTATSLLDGYAARATGPDAVRALPLRRASVDEASGDYASALAAYTAEAALLEADGEAALAGAFRAVAEAVAARAAEADSSVVVVDPDGGAASQAEGLPAAFALLAAYPNPSPGGFTVPLALPDGAHVRVAAYDLLGRRVAVLADGAREAGTHRLALDGSRLAAGVYIVRAVVTPEGGAVRTFARRLTVAR